MIKNSILTEDEQEQAKQLLEKLKTFIKAVPVAHYTKPTSTANGRFSGNFYNEDYTASLTTGGHVGIELVKLVKLFSNRLKHENNLDVWAVFIREIPENECDADYRNFVNVHKLTVPENLAHCITQFLTRRHFGGNNYFNTLVEYLYKPFRNQAPTRDQCYFAPQDAHHQHLFQTVREYGNKERHKEKNLFSAPPLEAPEDEQLVFYRNCHLTLALFILLVFNRFYNELVKLLTRIEDLTIELPSEERTAQQAALSKKILNTVYIEQVHAQAMQSLRQQFRSTPLNNLEQLANQLPELMLRGQNADGITVIDEGGELLSEDQTHRRKIVVGAAGSGKTVMLLRMLLRDQPRLTPFYLSLEKTELPPPEQLLSQLDRQVIDAQCLTISEAERLALVNRLHNRLAEGSAVFFIDSLDAADKRQRDNLLQFIRQYPLCQYILATQPFILIGELREELRHAGFSEYTVMPFDDDALRQATRMVSLHVSGVDHTVQLLSKIQQATQNSDMSHHPFSLMQLIYLFESNEQRSIVGINRTRLYWNLTERIRQNKEQLDDDERAELLEQPFLTKFDEQLQSVVDLYYDVADLFHQRPQGDWRTPIEQFPLIATTTDSNDTLRLLFELMELIELKDPSLTTDQANEFRTLVTVALLQAGEKPATEGLAQISLDNSGQLCITPGRLPFVNPMLRRLADATYGLQLSLPASPKPIASQQATLIYRPQPRYIVQQYLATVLAVYQQAGANLTEHNSHLRRLFEAVAHSGSQQLIAQLFSPYWMRLWLINADDELPATQLRGMARHNNPLERILIEQCVIPQVLLFHLLEQKYWIDGWQLTETADAWNRIMRDTIVYYMNDDQREQLFRLLPKLPPTTDHTTVAYHANLLIASMESLSLVGHYDASVSRLPGYEVQNRITAMKGRQPALRLLTIMLSQLLRHRPDDFQRLNAIASHLIKYGVPTMPELQNDFWQYIAHLAQNSNHPATLGALLDSMPIEDIRSDVARQVYDERIYDYLLSVRQKERTLATRWQAPPSHHSWKASLYRPVSPLYQHRRRIQYTFYCHPDNVTFEVATECIDEMPEGKFCRLYHPGGKPLEQWFHVEDVVVIPDERPITHLAGARLPRVHQPDRGQYGAAARRLYAEAATARLSCRHHLLSRSILQPTHAGGMVCACRARQPSETPPISAARRAA